jgi:hypothetical protein
MVNSNDYSQNNTYETTSISVNGLEGEIYKIIDSNAAPMIGYLPDLHVSSNVLTNALTQIGEKASGYERVYVPISDVDDKTSGRLDIFNKFGLIPENELELNYISNKLGAELGSDFFYAQTIEKHGGIERYLNLVEDSGQFIDRDKEILSYNSSVERLKSSDLESKISSISQNMSDEEREQFLINNLKNRAFNYGCTAHNMEKVANTVDEYNTKVKSGEISGPEIVLISGGGNHDSIDSYETLNEFTKHTTVHHINNIGGAIELGSGDDKINFQLASNCYSSTPVGDTFGMSPQEVALVSSPHTNDFTLKQGYTPSDFNNYNWDTVKENSYEYNRLTFNGKDKTSLDFMLYHQEMGDNAKDYEKLTNSANLFSNLGLIIHQKENVLDYNDTGLKMTYSGHFHSGVENHIDEEWGQIRNRYQAVIIDKNGSEKLNVGKPEELIYDHDEVLKYGQMKFEELVNLYNSQKGNASNDAEYREDDIDKAA